MHGANPKIKMKVTTNGVQIKPILKRKAMNGELAILVIPMPGGKKHRMKKKKVAALENGALVLVHRILLEDNSVNKIFKVIQKRKVMIGEIQQIQMHKVVGDRKLIVVRKREKLLPIGDLLEDLVLGVKVIMKVIKNHHQEEETGDPQTLHQEVGANQITKLTVIIIAGLVIIIVEMGEIMMILGEEIIIEIGIAVIVIVIGVEIEIGMETGIEIEIEVMINIKEMNCE